MLIIGAGPAGLTTGFVLGEASQRAMVMDLESTYVGGRR